MDKNITLIIPVYNVENYLIQCLESVVNQSVLFDEVIMVNDGSTDGSRQICETYASGYPYFKLQNQENKGLSAARNAGILYAGSEYVMFLDSDDYLASGTVKTLKNILKNYQYDAVYFDADIHCEEGFEEGKNRYDRGMEEWREVPMTGWDFFNKCYPKNYIIHSCMAVYRKHVLINEKIRFPVGLYFEDNYFSFVFLNYAKRVGYTSKKLYCRRYRRNSITTSNYSERKLADHIRIGKLLWDEIDQNRKSVLTERRELLVRFISDYFTVVLKNWQLCTDQKIFLSTDTKRLLEDLAGQYLFLLDKLSLYDTKKLPLLNRVLENLDRIFPCNINDRNRVGGIIRDITKRQRELYGKLLKTLPFDNPNYKAAIYGMGDHTEGMIAIYEKIIGKITCELIFLDSCQSDGVYRGKKILNYRNIDKSIQMIVISSFLYEKEMIANIQSIDSTIIIHSFYDNLKEDVFSRPDLFLKYVNTDL